MFGRRPDARRSLCWVRETSGIMSLAPGTRTMDTEHDNRETSIMKHRAILDEELETFEEKRRELLEHHEGKYVLIRGSEVVNVFDAERDAIDYGYKHFGNVPFLARKIVEVETPLQMICHPIGS